MEPKPDRTTILAIRVLLGLTVWLTLCNTAFQACQIPFKEPWWLVSLITGTIGAVVYTTYDKKRFLRLHSSPLTILLVEDSPAQSEIIRRGLLKRMPYNHITVASSAEEALQILRREGSYGLSRRPDLIVLDKNLPSMQGAEFAKKVKSDPEFSDVEIIGLSIDSVSSDDDILLYCSAWVEKGQGPNALVSAIQDIKTKLIEKKQDHL